MSLSGKEKDVNKRQEEAKNWAAFISGQYSLMMDNLPMLPRDCFYLCSETLLDSGFSYIDDLNRFTKYHTSVQDPNDLKQAAFTAKWITYMKPVQVVKKYRSKVTGEKNVKLCVQINELLALHCAGIHMEFPMKIIPSQLKTHMLYTLKHRNFTEHMLLSTFTSWVLYAKNIDTKMGSAARIV